MRNSPLAMIFKLANSLSGGRHPALTARADTLSAAERQICANCFLNAVAASGLASGSNGRAVTPAANRNAGSKRAGCGCRPRSDHHAVALARIRHDDLTSRQAAGRAITRLNNCQWRRLSGAIIVLISRSALRLARAPGLSAGRPASRPRSCLANLAAAAAALACFNEFAEAMSWIRHTGGRLSRARVVACGQRARLPPAHVCIPSWPPGASG